MEAVGVAENVRPLHPESAGTLNIEGARAVHVKFRMSERRILTGLGGREERHTPAVAFLAREVHRSHVEISAQGVGAGAAPPPPKRARTGSVFDGFEELVASMRAHAGGA